MILDIVLANYEKFYEIPITAEPNTNFDCTVDGEGFSFEVRTNIADNTLINILKDGEVIASNAPISILKKNLNAFSTYTKGAFFFFGNDLQNPTYENLGNEIRLGYVSF